ncbi:hypothetical protein Vafri_10539 [Volvox africanus]|uniref:Uncharacterized protein n=1 Tax=Volvox africanus TaxID=51714 RepID=A0A8J4B6B4_9CHLO|nr:hypothetical protein Vafri_10539 [Volvox africanus]
MRSGDGGGDFGGGDLLGGGNFDVDDFGTGDLGCNNFGGDDLGVGRGIGGGLRTDDGGVLAPACKGDEEILLVDGGGDILSGAAPAPLTWWRTARSLQFGRS